MAERQKKLGLVGLVAIVVSAMVGGGIYNLPSNMSEGAAAGAVMLAWVLTGLGMFFLATSFRALSDARPDLDSGIYAYAHDGFGDFVGFEMAWGYWLSAVFGNVGYAVLTMDSAAYFFPPETFSAQIQAFIGGSVLIWSMCAICLFGVSTASVLNTITTIAKMLPLLVLVVILAIFFSASHFTFDFWGEASAGLGGLGKQLKSTMLVTLWAFIGIEGAVVVSGRARNADDVGRATIISLLMCLTLYVLISLLPYGFLSQAELAKLPTPSAAYVLEKLVGPWGASFINAGVIIALLGSWLSWTIMVVEVPHVAAKDGVFPKIFAKENRHESPYVSLLVTSLFMQLTMFVVLFAKDAWLFLVDITGVMILYPYFVSAVYLSKLCMTNTYPEDQPVSKSMAQFSGGFAAVYALWLLYAATPKLLLLSSILFALGLGVFWKAKREQGAAVLFVGWEKVGAVMLVGIAITAAVFFGSGYGK
ncbi:basic amino acid/polyamine antiporter [Halodesulfovibrio marinisediminis]|uniref:Arginine:ornithine antiporter / lysine permease n=1 Tax=Halodesulfovibrio marinisediminis DSM 17456 TaxID=1121457 RepID=A0A1N6FVE1_9BACT|nr:basic amino acid/polyamine antiporter [Halodesulfovibrio marinisediminis]SIN99244.1 arginine:ornithine antiporter / lysine permease [Halodesulfovibrio marinisediminis DSM 17456]